MAALHLIDLRAREPLLTGAEQAALHAAPWLDALTPAARQDVLRQCRVGTLRADQGVWPGSSGPALCGVASGALSLRVSGPGGEAVDYLPPGTWFADANVLGDGTCALVARAHRRATVVTLPAAVLHDLASRHACLDRPMLALSGALTSRLLRILDELATCPLKTRLARCLLRLVQAFGVAQCDGIRLALAIHQGELAGLVRASRQRLNLELNRLQAAGIVRIDKELLLTDLDALRALARAGDLVMPASARHPGC